jgi:formylglycine-generating enzyme required for sulfatase activity
MKSSTNLWRILFQSTLAVGFLCVLNSFWLNAAQKQGGVILVPERKTLKPRPKKTIKNPTAAPTPVLLPEIMELPIFQLVPISVSVLTEAPVLALESEPIPVAPAAISKTAEASPPVLETFSFKMLAYDKRARIKDEREKTVKTFREQLSPDVWLEVVEIPGGVFTMGAPVSEIGPDTERPQHLVTVPQFWVGKYEVTQEQWRAVAMLPKVKIDLKREPSSFKGNDKLPVDTVSWYDAVEFCDRLQQKTGRGYRLLTEAEWEYAARAGTITPYAFGETITPKIVNYNGNHPYWEEQGKGEYREKTIPVGSLGRPNAFGLFDMYGNVWEWCQDHWHPDYKGAPSDGTSWESQEPSFNLVEQSLVVLRSQGVPGDVLEKLQRIKDFVFTGEEPFLVRLKTEIGEVQTLKFKALILKHANWDRPRVIRGCSWVDAGVNCRSAFRVDYGHPTLRRNDQGFRVAVSSVF